MKLHCDTCLELDRFAASQDRLHNGRIPVAGRLLGREFEDVVEVADRSSCSTLFAVREALHQVVVS
eukprot:8814873-Pyramimonas_sp.AAC.1